MLPLEKIADVLVSYARSEAPGSIPKVSLSFLFDPSDIDGIESWKISVQLIGDQKIDGDGEVVASFDNKWEVISGSPDTCTQGALAEITRFLKNAILVHMTKQVSLESTLSLAMLEPAGQLWPQVDPQADADLSEDVSCPGVTPPTPKDDEDVADASHLF